MVLIVPFQLEEISKFLMPGQYNNMIWFYQESEETPDASLVEEDVNGDKVSWKTLEENKMAFLIFDVS